MFGGGDTPNPAEDMSPAAWQVRRRLGWLAGGVGSGEGQDRLWWAGPGAACRVGCSGQGRLRWAGADTGQSRQLGRAQQTGLRVVAAEAWEVRADWGPEG